LINSTNLALRKNDIFKYKKQSIYLDGTSSKSIIVLEKDRTHRSVANGYYATKETHNNSNELRG
jgi:hypothetical protein